MDKEAWLNYADDRDEAFLQVRKVVRRINSDVDAVIKREHALAELEGREVQLDLSLEGVKRLVLKTAIERLGGVSSELAIESHDQAAETDTRL